jgi:hypothetical protein
MRMFGNEELRRMFGNWELRRIFALNENLWELEAEENICTE